MITTIDKKTALVLIDLQKGIASGNTVHPVKNILEKSAQLIDAFRKAHLPIVIVHVDPAGGLFAQTRKDVTAPPMNLNQLPPNFTEIVPEINVQPGDIRIMKKSWNAFSNPDLHAELQQREITGIVLGGISTSIGVEGTARAAAEKGYQVTFATDAMTDRVEDAHNNSLKYIFPRLGELGMVEEIIRFLPKQ